MKWLTVLVKLQTYKEQFGKVHNKSPSDNQSGWPTDVETLNADLEILSD